MEVSKNKKKEIQDTDVHVCKECMTPMRFPDEGPPTD